jgi:hypothetical protein
MVRSTKPCGPGTPMLVSSFAGLKSCEATVAKKAGTPGRARYKSSNIARGMPECFGCTCGDTRVRFLRYFLHTSLRVQRHPAFPAPSDLRGPMLMHNPGKSRRGVAESRPRQPGRQGASGAILEPMERLPIPQSPNPHHILHKCQGPTAMAWPPPGDVLIGSVPLDRHPKPGRTFLRGCGR